MQDFPKLFLQTFWTYLSLQCIGHLCGLTRTFSIPIDTMFFFPSSDFIFLSILLSLYLHLANLCFTRKYTWLHGNVSNKETFTLTCLLSCNLHLLFLLLIIILFIYYLVKAMVFPVIMCGCESWTVKKAESWRIDIFELWCWRRLLRVPWTARRSNQSILKEISPGCSLEGMMLKLKLQYCGHLTRRVDSLKKTLMLGGIGGRRRRDDRGWDGWMASLTRWTWAWVNSRSWWWTGRPGVLPFMGSQRVGHDWATELNYLYQPCYLTLCYTTLYFLL